MFSPQTYHVYLKKSPLEGR